MIGRAALARAVLAGMNSPARAQMDHSQHRPTPAPAPAPVTAPEPAPAPAPARSQSVTPVDPHAGHDRSAMPAANGTDAGHGTGGTSLPAGNAPAPAPPAPNYADRFFDARAMAAARDRLRREHGGGVFRQVIVNLAEVQFRDGNQGYRWEGEGWIGGDINRFVFKTEGAGGFGEGVDDAEVQALYSRAIGPYFDLQAGVRYDIRPGPSRVYAAIGVEGLAPYWFDVEGTLFLSDRGELLGRLSAYYDQRITQRIIAQPRLELNFAAQHIRETGVGAGLSDIELGLRVRYEIEREFAPYVGISLDRKLGAGARFAREAGESAGGVSFVLGVRTWF